MNRTMSLSPPQLTRSMNRPISQPKLTRSMNRTMSLSPPQLTRSIKTSISLSPQQLETETPPMMLRTRRIEYDYNLTEEQNSLKSLLSNIEETYNHEVFSLSNSKNMEELKDKIRSFNHLLTRLETKYPQYTDRNKMRISYS